MKNVTEFNKEELSKEQSANWVDCVINVRRVTKVTKGGKRFSFSALVVSGDQKGRAGLAQGKSREVSAAIAKATNRARKNLVEIPLRGSTIPYNVNGKHGASKVIMCSASKGTGLIAGGAVRLIMEALGVKDILTKSLGSSNRNNTVKAALNALSQLRSAQTIEKLRGRTIDQIMKGSHERSK